MSNALTDSQQQAIAARGNVIVVAGAGTGKTSTLVRRCITLLEEGCSLENILMVTFTEAAAVEMRGRIREALQTRVDALKAGGGHEALGRFEMQLALLDSAYISTLHSFCMQLVREHFYELGIDPDVSVLDEQQTQPMIQQVLDRIFESHYGGNSDDSRAVQQLVRVQGRGSDEHIRALTLKLHRYSQSLASPSQWLDEQRAMFNSPEPRRWREWLVDGFHEWRELWLPCLNPFRATPAVAIAFRELEAAAGAKDIDRIADAVRAIKAADAERANWPRGSIGKVRDPLEKFFEEVEFLSSISPGRGTDPLKEDWELIRQDMLTLLNLSGEFTAEFSRMKRETGGVDFADLEQFALRVLRDDSGAPSPTALRWRGQLAYVFVDEYQDINAAQDAILSAVSREGADANRFLVGDVKQSIYRFRLANPSIFRSYEKLWSKGNGCQRIPLIENFRSREGIIGFVNAFFGAFMRDTAGGVGYEPLQFGAPELREPLSAKADKHPRVELNLILPAASENNSSNGSNGENGEAVEIADLLATEREARLTGLRLKDLKEAGHEIWDKTLKQLRPVRWSDMAVLLRSPAGRVEAFAKEFANLGIPLEAARAGFFQSPEVSDLVSLLQLLDNPMQDVPLLAVLHSPLVGMSVAELAEVRASEPLKTRPKFFYDAAWRFHSRNKAPQADGSCPPVESAWLKLDTFFRQMHRWRELVRQSSVSHCLETALAETHYELMLRAGERGEQQIANVRRLVDLAREYDPYQRQGLFRFLRFIRSQEENEVELEPAAVDRDAVRLTSIHRSKGLEFPVVALAGIGARFNERDLHDGILLDEYFGICSKVNPPGSDQRYPSLPHWLARRRQFRELLGEELRLLYVAMTRARDTLLLIGTSRRKTDGPSEPETRRAFEDKDVLSAHSYLDWLRMWLPQQMAGVSASNGDGQSTLLRFRTVNENDPIFALTGSNRNVQQAPSADDSPLPNLVPIQERLAWVYPWEAATRQRTKTTVTELRRSLNEEEAESAPFALRNAFAQPKRATGRLNAAETGVAHHRFLQVFPLNTGASEAALRAEAKRLVQSGWLEAAEAAALDLSAVAAFWNSEFGSEILARGESVHRELPFTFGLSLDDLKRLRLHPLPGLAGDETVVVQGVVDLAVILPDEIWIVDFKTDSVTELEVPSKVALYEPQLRLYAHALSRIYRRPVTRTALYFLSTGSLAPVG